jgi:hypothetical protein
MSVRTMWPTCCIAVPESVRNGAALQGDVKSMQNIDFTRSCFKIHSPQEDLNLCYNTLASRGYHEMRYKRNGVRS